MILALLLFFTKEKQIAGCSKKRVLHFSLLKSPKYCSFCLSKKKSKLHGVASLQKNIAFVLSCTLLVVFSFLLLQKRNKKRAPGLITAQSREAAMFNSCATVTSAFIKEAAFEYRKTQCVQIDSPKYCLSPVSEYTSMTVTSYCFTIPNRVKDQPTRSILLNSHIHVLQVTNDLLHNSQLGGHVAMAG
jgi:hypothetical protein